ncbi:hypothetical protein [Acinetobacter indicus]|uniref:hypothetical protein n=1 Tax=Acinetobacter indicus TaxID=756892 RepID=UPI000CEB9672|nr:hypothetical protein [Acinetobacter indicus]
MSIKLKIGWTDNNAIIEGVRIYKSSSLFDVNTLPAVHAEITDGSLFYEDFDVTDGQIYFYMLSCFIGEQEVFTECYEVDTNSSTGYWIVAISHYGTATHADKVSTNTTHVDWLSNFGKTIDFGAFTRNYQGSPPATTTTQRTAVINKTINLNPKGLRFNVQNAITQYVNQKTNCDLFFEDALGNILAVIELRSPANYTNAVRYGASIETLISATTTGTNPRFVGELQVHNNKIKFISENPAHGVDDFEFFVDLSTVAQIRVANLWAETRMWASVDGTQAYFTMKCLGRI